VVHRTGGDTLSLVTGPTGPVALAV
jgi:hypothetical protein